jgi:uncharacterized YigZ family protein
LSTSTPVPRPPTPYLQKYPKDNQMEYLTVQKFAKTEYIINKSRFIGYCTPVSDADEAVAFIEKIRAMHRDATHNVYAYSIRTPEYSRYSDDGEPQGTAGMPTLDVIKKNGVTDVCIVVTRYFGGILLGAGGLVRAYSHSAKLTLEESGIVRMGLCDVFELTGDYKWYDRLVTLLSDSLAITENTEFTDKVKITFRLKQNLSDEFNRKLTELTFGEIKAEKIGEKFDICK